MEISGYSTFYAGLGAAQAGHNRVDQAASQSSDYQAERLHAVDRSQQMNLLATRAEKPQDELDVKVAKASDEMLGTLIDTYA